MLNRTPALILLFLFLTTLSGCDTIIDIFQAGIWFTIISITVIIILLVLLLSFRGISPQKVREPEAGQRSDLDLP